MEVRIVLERASICEVRLINEVPVVLPAEAHALDVIGKSGALSEGVLVLILSQARVVLLERGEDIESGIESLRSISLK